MSDSAAWKLLRQIALVLALPVLIPLALGWTVLGAEMTAIAGRNKLRNCLNVMCCALRFVLFAGCMFRSPLRYVTPVFALIAIVLYGLACADEEVKGEQIGFGAGTI
mgnify:CR=1 FL=1